DHGVAHAQVASGYPVSEPTFDRRDVIGVALDPCAGPALVQQVARIVLETVADTELEELPIAHPDATEDLRQDAVFLVWRVDGLAGALETQGIVIAWIGEDVRDESCRRSLVMEGGRPVQVRHAPADLFNAAGDRFQLLRFAWSLRSGRRHHGAVPGEKR